MAKTKSCDRCGEVILKINSICEDAEIICQKCNNVIYFNAGKYTTYEKKCSHCENDLFKLRRYDYGDKEIIKIECTKCKGEPKQYYVDREGNKIDRSVREILLIKDTIESVENNVYNIEDTISDIDNRVYYLESEVGSIINNIYSKDEMINGLEDNVDNIKSDIYSMSSEIDRLKNDIENIDNQIYRLEREF